MSGKNKVRREAKKPKAARNLKHKGHVPAQSAVEALTHAPREHH
jgi:hypothetical protein